MGKKFKNEFVQAEIEHRQEMDDLSKDFEKQSRIAENRIEIDLKKERYTVGTQMRKAVLNKYQHKCRDCSETDEDLLEIHHNDMDNSHNYLSNLIPLCQNCHTKRHKNASMRKYFSTGIMGKVFKKSIVK